ncbi:hypothetical protein JOF41_007368 [Saccharothrix coeruleofusca]|uniref:phage portal protein n=1 Tax=Saccharothrix coeruleofusca TaxID=33919 RepID=UPI001AE799BA|nr:phage portal protein [Saccharothrix coeruleofusca]MBP2341114.1 hypothetical protein [Saccharothrix coeruleofusca]
MARKSVVDLVGKELWPGWRAERDRLNVIDAWYRWTPEPLQLPRDASPELKALRDLSETPWLNLVVTTVAQCMYVDAYRSPLYPPGAGSETGESLAALPGPWRTWKANKFDNRQIAVHRAMLAYGYAFVRVLPGMWGGVSTASMRGVSPRKAYAVYADPAEDDWPMFVLQVEKSGDKLMLRFYDEQDVHFLSCDQSGGGIEYITYQTHGAGVTPFVRYANMLDLDGRSDGEVKPFIPAAKRINKTAYDRLLAQHFNSWKIRYATGMAKPDDPAEQEQVKMLLRNGDLLMSTNKDTRFGTLDETPLDPFVNSWRADIEALAAVSQTPTYTLTGQLVNLSADALAAARAGLRQKVYERQKTTGTSHVQALQLAAQLEGREEDAVDVMARVSWQDMEIRSLAQAADALGKFADQLQIPVKALWGMIPGVEKSDVDEWAAMQAADPLTVLADRLEQQADGGLV